MSRFEVPYTPLSPLVVFPSFPSSISPGSPLSPDEAPTYNPIDLPEDAELSAIFEVIEKNMNQFFGVAKFKIDLVDDRINRLNTRLENVPKGRTTYFELLSKYKSTVKEFQLLIRTMEKNKKRLLRDNEEQREKNKELRKIMALQSSGIQKNLSNEKRDYRLKRKKRKKRKNRISEILQLQNQLQKRLHQHQRSQLKKSQKSPKDEEKNDSEEIVISQNQHVHHDNNNNNNKQTTKELVEKKIERIQQQQQRIRQVPLINFGSNVVWRDKNFQRLLKEMVSWKTKSNLLKIENSNLQKKLKKNNSENETLKNENIRMKNLLFGERKRIKEMNEVKEEIKRFEGSTRSSSSTTSQGITLVDDDDFSILNKNVVKFKRLSNGKYIKYKLVDEEKVIRTKKRFREREGDYYSRSHIAFRVKNFEVGMNIL